MKRAAPRRAQAGMTLIGMMVGLLISLLTIAAMMAIYKMVVEVSGNASRTAIRDGQVALATLATQIEMQQAGFGIVRAPGAPDASLLQVREDASGSRAVWRFRPDLASANEQCAGVEVVRSGETRGIYWLAPKACGNAGNTTWSGSERRPLASGAAFFQPLDRSGNVLADEAGAHLLASAAFRLDGTCNLPYSQRAPDTSAAYPLAQRLALKAGEDDAAATLFSVCLPNIVTAVVTPPAAAGAGNANTGA